MIKRCLAWVGLLLFIALIVLLLVPRWRVAVFAAVTGDVVYRGKTSGEWRRVLTRGREEDRREASVALLEAFTSGPYQVRLSAACPLRCHAEVTADMVPALLEVLDEEPPRFRGDAAIILARVDPGDELAWAALLQGLKDDRANVRSGVAMALVQIGPRGRTAIPPLVTVWKGDEQAGVRRGAAFALAHIGLKPNPVIPILREDLRTASDELAARTALCSLGDFAEDAKDALPELLAAMEDRHSEVRRLAAEVIGKVGVPDERAVSALERALKDKDTFVRTDAATAHWRLKRDAKTVVPVLVKLLGPNGADGASEVYFTLGEIGPEAREAIPLLRAALGDGREWRRRLVRDTLVKIDPGAAE